MPNVLKYLKKQLFKVDFFHLTFIYSVIYLLCHLLFSVSFALMYLTYNFVDIDECDYCPCQRESLCYDQPGSYLCYCYPGFDGVNCETSEIL